ncbi:MULTISPECIES: flagellar filament capping protein FliD [Pseudomonas]|jgi:flagellar hook-associated protein 2|uniref:Flagellar hook-associated protein 2 n=1 Tax=Pseudomonas edaphica TaxID=2006980 RepID=A0A7Y7RUK5_9PSED|nr:MULTISPECIES: flagellar filament capping protein FliD [Pseudomonas]MCF5229712.1 flagellar filament capping protein FliD [Pseudomonas sp. PA-5-4H]MCF5237851.1 flagellar filament capping protein FliD [Pseudomonas sp. PA-5-4G]MCF5249862.1 flagellar filament capping protein FliD [Pseudomonas sp. PA-5-4B]MCF5253065.1 flagellar filament capping protein FliD [Pseudomonas sp. PA-5-4B]MCF5259099.1 flagellar filament capping protein FliD [Pseudomonas sp. PA-5-4A]
MGDITVSGPVTGINTESIVTALVNAEQAPKQSQINKQTQTQTAQLSSIGKIQAALDAFRGAMDNMAKDASIGGLTATTSDANVSTVTLGAGASAGSYQLVVNQLATASKIATQNYPGGAKTVVNAGTAATTLEISQSGQSYGVSVPPGATLQQVRDSINAQYSSAGLSANILTDSTGSRLVVTSTNTGAGTDITLGGNSGLQAGAAVVGDPPQNAKYTIDGTSQESKSNTLTEAISGVSIKLTAVSPLPTGVTDPSKRIASTITVTRSNDTLKSSVKGFVDTYNALMTAIGTETKVTTNADGSTTPSALTGDATMRSLQQALRSELNALGGSGTLKSLAQFGVNTDQTTGKLSIDDKIFSAAVATNPTDIGGIFNGDKGLLARMKTATDSFALSNTGVLATRSTTLSNNLKDLQNQQDTLTARMAALKTSLTAKYTTMNNLVAQLTSQRSSVMTTLNALNKSNSDS